MWSSGVGSSSWTYHGAVIVPANLAAGVWTDIDLSAIVGARRVMVLLRLRNDSTGAAGVAVRAKGDTDLHMNASAANMVDIHAGVTQAGLFVGYTDSSGVIQYWCAAGAQSTLDLIAWILVR